MSSEQINWIIVGVVLGVVVVSTVLGFLAYRYTKKKKLKNIQHFKKHEQDQIFEIVDNEVRQQSSKTKDSSEFHDDSTVSEEDLNTTKKFDSFIAQEDEAIDNLDDLINGDTRDLKPN